MRPKFAHRDIRLRASVSVSPQRLYGALTSARELCIWWTDRAETELRNLGRVRLLWNDLKDYPDELRGVFVDLEPARKIGWVWARSCLPAGAPLLTSIFLEPERRAGCRITILHAGFSSKPSSDRAYERWGRIWEDCLSKLVLYAESGRICKPELVSLSELELLRKK